MGRRQSVFLYPHFPRETSSNSQLVLGKGGAPGAVLRMRWVCYGGEDGSVPMGPRASVLGAREDEQWTPRGNDFRAKAKEADMWGSTVNASNWSSWVVAHRVPAGPREGN
jgi:hypothetical protein